MYQGEPGRGCTSHDNGRGTTGGRGRIPFPAGTTGGTRRIPFPTLPAPPVDVVNRYQILGPIPKPFNSILAIQPKVNDLFDICSPEPQPKNYRNYSKLMT